MEETKSALYRTARVDCSQALRLIQDMFFLGGKAKKARARVFGKCFAFQDSRQKVACMADEADEADEAEAFLLSFPFKYDRWLPASPYTKHLTTFGEKKSYEAKLEDVLEKPQAAPREDAQGLSCIGRV